MVQIQKTLKVTPKNEILKDLSKTNVILLGNTCSTKISGCGQPYGISHLGEYLYT